MEDKDPGPIVDHENKDTEDNAWHNLRRSTFMDNQLNAKHNRSIPHVYPDKLFRYFQVKINGRYCGARRSLSEAIELRNTTYSQMGRSDLC